MASDSTAQVDTQVDAGVLRWIAESHLDLPEARALLALNASGQAMTAAEVAELAGMDLDSAYRAIHKLHVRRLTCEESRRHELTARGRELMRSYEDAGGRGVGI
jgi:DNA-binding MarR family transcriptional regulator